MQYLRRSGNPNALAAILALILLGVFAGPNTLPRLIESVFPAADSGSPCWWLREASGRAARQSLIGRAASSGGLPLEVQVDAEPLPTTPDGTFSIRITFVNRSIGTIPIVYDPDTVAIGDTGGSGAGIIFNAQTTPAAGVQQVGSYPEDALRLLGPRQRCVHRITLTANQAAQFAPNIGTGTATVIAYYRNTTRGGITAAQLSGLPQQIFPDQGLWVGVVASEPVVIPLGSGS